MLPNHVISIRTLLMRVTLIIVALTFVRSGTLDARGLLDHLRRQYQAECGQLGVDAALAALGKLVLEFLQGLGHVGEGGTLEEAGDFLDQLPRLTNLGVGQDLGREQLGGGLGADNADVTAVDGEDVMVGFLKFPAFGFGLRLRF